MYSRSEPLLRTPSSFASASRPAGVSRGRRRGTIVPPVRATSSSHPNEELLGAFFYGRAFAITLSKRLGADLVEGISAVGSRLATREARIRSFQEEVAALAKQEMLASAGFVAPTLEGTSAGSSTSGGSASAGSTTEPQIQDIQANVDDLRATIASARAVLQQIRRGEKPNGDGS